MRKARLIVEYRGVTIFRKTTPGHALRWNARTSDGRSLAADTLAGMKELIRESQT